MSPDGEFHVWSAPCLMSRRCNCGGGGGKGVWRGRHVARKIAGWACVRPNGRHLSAGGDGWDRLHVHTLLT